jgi:dimethylhistidine N-methyltransferase
MNSIQEKALTEILDGLSKKEKVIPPRYFYDQRGSQLFDEISGTEEYYITRTEIKILRENVREISEAIGDNVLLIEFGSGSSVKTRIILENCDITGYIPIDISYDHLIESVNQLKELFPDLKIYPMHADYSEDFTLPETDQNFKRKIIFFPGSTIGNFTPREAEEFMEKAAMLAGDKGGMLLGFDLVKDHRLLEAAYNDRSGVTSEFNLNILDNVNNLTGSDFDKNNFEHLAFYNNFEKRIEMHLVSRSDQFVNINNRQIKIGKGENILTEYSYKYSFKDITELTKEYFTMRKIWTDKNKFFAVVYLTAD